MIDGREKRRQKRKEERQGSKKRRQAGDLKAQSHENFQYFSDERLIVNS